MNEKYTSPVLLLLSTLLLIGLQGCAGQSIRAKSSVVDYLYPDKSATHIEPSIPVLHLPIKVAIAFVPEQAVKTRSISLWTSHGGNPISESEKLQLLEKVAAHFKKQPFVSDIEVIPSTYLTPGGGFANLDQIRTMYGADVIALVSYDQAQFTDEGMLSFTYWTLIGAYMVSGEKNDTQTMLDTVVYDIQSRKMLFRAPGTSHIKGHATPVNLSEELREDSLKGFTMAAEKMTINLETQLEKFKKKIKEHPEQAKIVHKKGYSGGGSMGSVSTLILSIIVLLLFVRRRKTAQIYSSVTKHQTPR